MNYLFDRERPYTRYLDEETKSALLASLILLLLLLLGGVTLTFGF